MTLEYSCTFLVYYSCTTAWSIHILTRCIRYYMGYCCYFFHYYYFWIIMQKNSLFLWHLSFSDCCCLLYTFYCLILFDSYTSILFVNILVNILIVFLHLFILLLTLLLFYYNFTLFVTLEYSCTFLVYYSCTLFWSIHILARFINYYLVYCCYCFHSYYFWIIMQKLTCFVTLQLFWLLLFIVYILLLNTIWFLYFNLIC